MKRTLSLSVAAVATTVLLAGCSGATPATTSTSTGAGAPATSTGTTSTSTSTSTATSTTTSTSQAPAQDDKTALLKGMMEAQKTVKYSTSTTESVSTIGGQTMTTKTVTLTDSSDPQNVKAHSTSTTTMPGASTPSENITILDGKTLYAKSGGTWTKTNLGADASAGPSAAPTLSQDEAMAKMLTMVKDVKLVGDEPVEGVPCKHYVVTLDMSSLFGGASAAPGAAGASAAADAGTSTTDYWLDAKQLVRKSVTKTKYGTTTTVTSKINEPVTVTVPAEAKAAKEKTVGAVPGALPSK